MDVGGVQVRLMRHREPGEGVHLLGARGNNMGMLIEWNHAMMKMET